jgi:hypothetical protein
LYLASNNGGNQGQNMSLTAFLQKKFKENCPKDWFSYSEVELLPPELSQMLGYSPRVDVLLENRILSRRYWIEFEISRADPVANHVKFATGHLFSPQSPNEIFVSMMSSHITRGRHNLAANTIFLMRRIGMSAFQTMLFPQLSPKDVKRLNHTSSIDELDKLNISDEIDRIFNVTVQINSMSQHKIFFTSNYAEVMLNLRTWNQEIESEHGKELWGKRTVTYFVFDPASEKFAPAKFCAFLPVDANRIGMDLSLYTELSENETRFDGTIARKHLVNSLGMIEKRPHDVPRISSIFQRWFQNHLQRINLHPKGYSFILPPEWY